MCSLWQDGQYVSDGPFLIGALLNGQLESELWLFALYQLQTILRLDVLDGATLRGHRETERKEVSGILQNKSDHVQQGEAVKE